MNIKISDHFTYKKLFTFVLPPVFMMILTSIYGVIDGYFISNFVGKTQFAAINFIYPFIMILGGTGFMIGTGGTALVAKTLGEGNEKRANELFTIMIKFCILLGIILTVSGILLIRPICILLKATEEMTDFCVIYGSIVISFTTFFMLQSNFHSFFSAAEKQRMGLAVTVIAGCANAALDALFIVVFDWGLVGRGSGDRHRSGYRRARAARILRKTEREQIEIRQSETRIQARFGGMRQRLVRTFN